MANKKEQMQIIAIAALMGCGAVFALIFFLVMPMKEETRTTREEAAKIQASLEDIRKVVRDRAMVQEQISEALARLKKAESLIPLPVLGNYMIEMEETIRNCLADTGVNIVAITSAGDPAIIQGGTGSFKVFQTRVVAESGYHELAKAFHNIQQKRPYTSVSGVTISPEEASPRLHTVNFVVSWLIWADPDNRPTLKEQEEQ